MLARVGVLSISCKFVEIISGAGDDENIMFRFFSFRDSSKRFTVSISSSSEFADVLF